MKKIEFVATKVDLKNMVWKPTLDVIVSVNSSPLFLTLVFPRVIKISVF